jgi:hypothetical protein
METISPVFPSFRLGRRPLVGFSVDSIIPFHCLEKPLGMLETGGD